MTLDNFLIGVRRWFQPVIETSWAMQRKVDIRVLWPVCKQLSLNIEEARHAFLMHAMGDPCWREYYGEKRLKEVVDEMT